MQPIGVMDGLVPHAQPAADAVAEPDETAFSEEVARQDTVAEESPEEEVDEQQGMLIVPSPSLEKPVAAPIVPTEATEDFAATAKAAPSETEMHGKRASSERAVIAGAASTADITIAILASGDRAGEVSETSPPTMAQRLVEAQMDNPSADLSQLTKEIAGTEAQSAMSDGTSDESGGEPMATEDPASWLIDGANETGGETSQSFAPHLPAHVSETTDRVPVVLPMSAETVVNVAEQIVASTDRSIDIALTPEELGRLRLTMTDDNGRLLVTLAADRPETLDLMRRSVDALAQELLVAGYASVEFTFANQDGRQREHTEKQVQILAAETADRSVARPLDYRTRPSPGSGGINLLL